MVWKAIIDVSVKIIYESKILGTPFEGLEKRTYVRMLDALPDSGSHTRARHTIKGDEKEGSSQFPGTR